MAPGLMTASSGEFAKSSGIKSSGSILDDFTFSKHLSTCRTDWDAGFVEGRQYGRGKTGGQVGRNLFVRIYGILDAFESIRNIGYYL